MGEVVLVNFRVVVVGFLILSLRVGLVLGGVVFFIVILGKGVLIVVLGESMIEKCLWVRVVLGFWDLWYIMSVRS